MNTTVSNEVIDYAYPTMMAEIALRNVHKAALHNDFEEAMDQARKAIVEMRLVLCSLYVMEEKRQTEIVRTAGNKNEQN